MPDTRPRRSIVAAWLALAAIWAGARSAHAAWATDSALVEWADRMRSAGSVSVRHELKTELTVPFHTKKPCAYLVRHELGRSRLDPSWMKRFVTMLGLPTRSDTLAACANPHCLPDSTGASKVTVTVGPRGDELTLDLEFDVVSATVRHGADLSCFSLEGRTDSLLAMMCDALPKDTVIRALKVETPMPTTQERSVQPPPGSSNLADELPETVRRPPPSIPSPPGVTA